MKFTLRCYLFMILAVISMTSFAQDIAIVDTSSPQDSLVEPTIVMTPVTVIPDCDTYTGCGLIVLKKIHYQRIHYLKHKRHRVYHQPCCVTGDCYMRPVIEQCY